MTRSPLRWREECGTPATPRSFTTAGSVRLEWVAPSRAPAVLVAKEGVRRLEAGDYAKGYLDLLAKLTTVGEVRRSPCSLDQVRFGLRRAGTTRFWWCHNLATGTLVVERKLIHGCGRVGHVEDVVVLPEARGQGLGHRVVSALVDEAKIEGVLQG